MGLFSAIGGLFGGIGGAIGGLIDGANEYSQASQASAQQAAMLASQARLYNLQADMGSHFFDQYKTNYEPLALSQLKAASVGVDPNYYAGLADNQAVQQNALALSAANRNLERAGVSPSDGRWLSMQNNNALALAGNRAGAQNQARQGALDLNWNRRQQQVDYGANMVNRGTNLMSGAANGMNGLANSYGQQAQAAGSAAGYSFNNAAQNIMNLWRGGGSNGGFGGF